MHEHGDLQPHPEPGRLAMRAREWLRQPWITWLAVAACLGVFVGITADPQRGTWAVLDKWGVRHAGEVWDGAYWSLVTSVLVHREVWHLAFNVYWLWVLGIRLEWALGHGRYLLFFLAAGLVSSAAQMAVSDTTGIGASGVGYAMFGFMWIARSRYPDFHDVLTPRTIELFILWLFACFALTYLDLVNVGNAAHVAGLLFGMAAAGSLAVKPRPPLAIPALAGLVVLALTPLFWCPWSPTWLGVQGYRAHEAGDYPRAVEYYTRLLGRDPRAAWAYFNRGAAYYQMGEDEKGHADKQRAAELDSQYRDQGE